MNNLDFDERELKSLCLDNGIKFLAVFGSVARGKAEKDSDIDLLAKFSEPKSLFELVDLEDQLSKVFGGRKTDLVTEGFLSPFIRESVKSNLKVIYGS